MPRSQIDPPEIFVGTDLATQVDKAAHNLRVVLEAAGASLADVTALRIYVVEAAASDLSPITAMLQRHFPQEAPPATTWLVVSALASDGLLVELEATAAVD